MVKAELSKLNLIERGGGIVTPLDLSTARHSLYYNKIFYLLYPFNKVTGYVYVCVSVFTEGSR